MTKFTDDEQRGSSRRFTTDKSSTFSRQSEDSQPTQRSDEIVVFIVSRDTQCAECGEELGSGRWLRMEQDKPLCMSCADLAHLEFLPRGNVALTRRATKYSPLRAVVVQWSR